MPGDSEELSIGGFDPQTHVLAWQNDLQEVLIIEEAVSITIVEIYELLAVVLSVLEDVVIA